MCGVVGISSNENVAADIYDALTMLQHRSQDAAGIMTCHKGQFLQRKGEGLVRDVFQADHMQRLAGNFGLGHALPNPREFRICASSAVLRQFPLRNCTRPQRQPYKLEGVV